MDMRVEVSAVSMVVDVIVVVRLGKVLIEVSVLVIVASQGV